jgi:hypothetical protein
MVAPPLGRVGLCAACRFAEVIDSSRGSTFYRCTLSDTDPAFLRYPILPVRRCVGYQPALPELPDDPPDVI